MIHARGQGETFGLAVAEFSVHNRPVFTTRAIIFKDTDRARTHLNILGSKAIQYNSSSQLASLLKNFNRTQAAKGDWNAYRRYEPEPVMRQFQKVFMGDCAKDLPVKISRNGCLKVKGV